MIVDTTIKREKALEIRKVVYFIPETCLGRPKVLAW